MGLLRRISGIVALVSILIALNQLVLLETLFIGRVVIPLGVGVAVGALWLLLRLTTLVGAGNESTKFALNTAVGTVVFLGICITVYAFVNRWEAEWDLTQEGRREISPQTIQVLEGLEEEVSVTCLFVSMGDSRIQIAQQKTERFLKRLQRHTTLLSVEIIDPQREPEILDQLNVKRVSSIGTVVLRCGTRQREIPLSDVTSRLEERAFTNSLINVIRDARPKVYFLTGHGERDIGNVDPVTGGSDIKLWLEKEAYEVDRLLIAVTNPVVPVDCDVLVVNGYRSDFHVHELDALDEYIHQGGRMLVLSDPQFVLPSALPSVEQFRPWLSKRFGIELGTDIIVSLATDSSQIMFIPDFSVLRGLSEKPTLSAEFRGSFNMIHPITRGLDLQFLLSAVRSVSIAETLPVGVKGRVLLQSTPDTWAETDLESVIRREPINKDGPEKGGPNPVAVAVSVRPPKGSSAEEARLVVVGDADFTSNEAIDLVANQNFVLNSIAWLAERQDLIAIRPTGREDPALILTEGQERMVAWIASLGTVQAIALAGFAMHMLRRRHQ